MDNRVVVTGMAAITALGSDWAAFSKRLRQRESGIRYMHDWDRYANLHTRLAAPVPAFEVPAHYPRKKTRTMGRVSLLATRACEQALIDAGLLGDALLTSGAVGVAYGSDTQKAKELLARLFSRHRASCKIVAALRREHEDMTLARKACSCGALGRYRARSVGSSWGGMDEAALQAHDIDPGTCNEVLGILWSLKGEVVRV